MNERTIPFALSSTLKSEQNIKPKINSFGQSTLSCLSVVYSEPANIFMANNKNKKWKKRNDDYEVLSREMKNIFLPGKQK